MDRIGAKMSSDLINKIARDIEDLDRNLPLFITPVSINEPFLDMRIFDILKTLHNVAPHAELIYFSNDLPLVSSVLDKFEESPKTRVLSLSLNDHSAAEYEHIMLLPFERTVQRFDDVHERN